MQLQFRYFLKKLFFVSFELLYNFFLILIDFLELLNGLVLLVGILRLVFDCILKVVDLVL